VGTEAVAKAPADGYTLLTTASTIVLNRSLFKSIPYDPVKISRRLRRSPSGGSRSSHPFGAGEDGRGVHAVRQGESRQAVLRLSGQRNAAPSRDGSVQVVAGIELTHVPYKGTPGAVQDLLGRQISVMFLPVHVRLPQVEAGKLNMLAAGGIERASATPNVPSLAEAAGVREVDTDIWYGLYAPAGTPRDVVAKLKAGGEAACLKEPCDDRHAAESKGLQPTGGSPDDLARLTKDDLERWAKVVRDAKIQPD
jgi:tripartite-type tricarboxylate transporter receptor subunit TctC